MGIEDIHKIDLVVEERDNGPIRLQMLEAREWSLSAERIEQLENKISAYYNFVESGQLTNQVPTAKGRKCVVELICQHEPPAKLISMFPQVRALFAQQKIDFRVVLARELGGSLARMPIFP